MFEKYGDFCVGLILGIILIVIYLKFFRMEKFLSGGTISQLFSKDSQDVFLNGSSINPIATGDFELQFNQPTLVGKSQRGDLLPKNSNADKYMLGQYVGETNIMPFNDIMKPLPFMNV